MNYIGLKLSILLGFVFLYHQHSFAQTTFSNEMIIMEPETNWPLFVCSADLDGDGDMDVFSASMKDNKVAWYENADGLGTFGNQNVIATNVWEACCAHAADLDGDGDMDVLAVSSGNYAKIIWYENIDGLGTFGTEQVITDSLDYAVHVFSEDLDGDGDMDVLASSYLFSSTDNKIVWFENIDSQGAFGVQHTISTSDYGAQCVSAKDLDGDGDMDILASSYLLYTTNNKIEWYENIDGQGAFTVQHEISTLADGVRSVYASDLDGDGDFDVLSASSEDSKIAWYENTDGQGNFGEQNVITNLAGGPRTVYAADLDGDNDMDVLYGAYEQDRVAWHENTNGPGLFGEQKVITNSADGVLCVTASNLDGDGDMDVLSASITDNKIAWYENVDGLGSFEGQLNISSYINWPLTVITADLDGDGDTDVLSTSLEDHKIAWYENTDGLGTFGYQQIISDSLREARTVYASDLDSDGDMDVLSASCFDDYIVWFENTDGLGTFGDQKVISNLTRGANYVYAVDLDGDEDMDVLSSSWADWKIAWYENTDGAGNFGEQQIITSSAKGANCVYAADLDGDGDMDVLSASRDDDTIGWYENWDGLGYFTTRKIITEFADGAWSVYASDLDGDGDMDVLSSSFLDGNVAWYENIDGEGSFGSPEIINSSSYSKAAQASDLDNDGDMDILSLHVDVIVWFENIDGQGEFGDEQRIGGGNGTTSVHPSDVDSDGDMDVLSAIIGGDKIVWYKNLFVETEVNVQESDLPVVYNLNQNFPNPFNNETLIQFDLKEKGNISLIVYDLLGKPVGTVVDGHYLPGRYQVKFRGDGLPSGIYFYKFQCGEFTAVRKMVIMD
jgi:hypothetical protein